ncbi:putative addiction module antidote protein [Rhizobium sp. TH2]|nr:putative addiction module antidote protein [Rhizobium sp. TH2]
MTNASKPLDFGFRDELLRDPEHAAFYLEQILESGNMELFQEALRNVAKAQEGGVSAVAKRANVNRENLYDALSQSGKPQMETITKTLSALGLRFSITPAHR